MKIRKLISAALALSLGMGLGVPALAAGTAEDRLTKVTLAVKETLGVTDEYEEFYGEPQETALGTRWNLSWTAEDKSLSVTATEAGKVLSMNQWQNSPAVVRWDGLHFPAMAPDEAKTLSDEFLAKVLSEGETALYDENLGSAGLNVSQYSFSGTICLNGIPSPLSFRVRVSVDRGTVTYFYRGDQTDYVGEVPAPDTVTTAEQARAMLAETLDLELIYVLDGESKQAVLRYVPRGTHDYYVDAATGTLVDLTELREKLANGSSADGGRGESFIKNEAAVDNAAGLSPAELEGIAKLEGILTKEELAERVKAWPELKLEGFEAASCSYMVERADPDAPKTDEPTPVTARLGLVKKADSAVERRYVTVDARTGELLSMSGYRGLYSDEPAALTQDEAQDRADAFLQKLWGDQWAKCEVYTSSAAEKEGDTFYFTYAQKVNGYFFPGNTISVGISAADGAVLHFNKSFDDEVTFDSAEGLIDLDTAKTAWAGTFELGLRYIAVPVALDLLGPEVVPLRNAGWSWYNALKPGYQWGSNQGYYGGVDAKTGLPLTAEAAEPEVMTYDDISGDWAESALLELATYNVGWWGGSARPKEELTQAEYLKLLSSADGYRYGRDDELDGLYAYAYSRGILTEAERDEDKVLTRANMVKMLLDSLGYKAVANLPGIFRCDYTDADAIPAGHMGYAALAQGLDLVVGDENGNYGAGQTALRAEAAVLLWRYLSR